MTTNRPANNFITMIDPDNVAAEAFRILRTNITLKDYDNNLKVINVISANAHESKSTTVLNLAYVFSQLEKRVLVIDLDLRLPTIHKKLKIKNKVGVSDLIAKKATFDEAVIRYTNKIDILLSGTKNPYATEYIQSATFKKMLESLREAYDMIIIDCPPVGLVTDGVIASTLCDGTILCVATGVNDRKDLERTRDLLKQFNVNILGIVMTRVPTAKRYYSKYGKYGYTSSDYYGTKKKAKKKS